jgi:hypothetical protein
MITDRRVASVLAVPADVASLGDIGDVDLAGLSDGDIIRYDSASGEWLPEAPVAPIQTVQATTQPAFWFLQRHGQTQVCLRQLLRVHCRQKF